MAPTDANNALDHLILFLPADSATNLPKIPSFISDNFTLTPGGVHADGLTSNTLILLSDGCYIELISFLPTAPPTSIASHWWSAYANSPGWADWCLTNALPPSTSHSHFQTTHNTPIHGGRTRPDGVDVKWAVTFPKAERGLVPFFCHDTTPREVRVPLSEAATSHPCGALGVQGLTVMVDSGEKLEEARGAYKTLLADLAHADASHSCFGAERVVPISSKPALPGAKVKLVLPRDDADRAKVRGRGFWYGDVVLVAPAGEGKPAGTKVRLDGEGDDLRGWWIVYV